MVNSVFNITTVPKGKRAFTLARANRALPLVRRIVEDIQQVGAKIGDYQEQYESLCQERKTVQAQQSMIALIKLRQDYERFCNELAQLGCRLADQQAGAVEFPAVVQGQDVILSWRLGQEEITFWHDPGQGPTESHSLQ